MVEWLGETDLAEPLKPVGTQSRGKPRQGDLTHSWRGKVVCTAPAASSSDS
jgi:hypothetical protein